MYLGPTTYGVAKRVRDNDPDLHENQTMYSCGSLAPRMSKGGGGGCSGGSNFKKVNFLLINEYNNPCLK